MLDIDDQIVRRIKWGQTWGLVTGIPRRDHSKNNYISEETATLIFTLIREKMRPKAIASKLGVSIPTVTAIKRCQTWKNLPIRSQI